MACKPITDQQVRLYMTDLQTHSQRTAAARAGFSERTARRFDADPTLPSNRKIAHGRTVTGLCCTNPMRDSSRESSVVAGLHEQTYIPRLQDQELARVQ